MNTKMADSNPIQSDLLPAIPEIRRIPEFIEFSRWCATPSWSRQEKTQKEFAERIGVSQDTLGDWKKHPNFWPLTWQLVRERMQEQIPDVIDGLYGKLTSGKGGTGDVQLFLRLAEGESKQTKNNKE
jgi:hypothetical protein